MGEELNRIADSVFKRYKDRRAGKEVLAPTKPSVVWMDTVTPRRLDYLIYPYVPLGVLLRKGISLKTLENARAVEGVISSPAGFGKGRILRLPTPEEQAEQQAEF